MGQGQTEEKKGKKNEKKVILKVDMDCEACKRKVRKVLKKFSGVEDMDLNMDEQTVTVKGDVDAYKIYEAMRKKCGKRTALLYPPFSKEDEQKAKEEAVISSVNKIMESINELVNPKPPDTVIELKVLLHCGACARKIKRRLLRMDGVMEVEEDLGNDKVVVKGRALNAAAVCDGVRETGKHCEVVSVKKEEKPQAKKGGEEKDEGKAEKSEGKDGKKGEKQEKQDGGTKGGKKGEKKEEKEEKEEKKEEKEEKGEKKVESKGEEAKAEEEGGKEEGASEAKGEKSKGKKKGGSNPGGQEGKAMDEGGQGSFEASKYAYTPYQSVPEYVYAPQLFSDENPNACSIM